MTTAGTDGKWKVWDLRKYDCVHGYHVWGTPPTSLDISMTGMVSVGFTNTVQIWKDALATKQKMPYLEERFDRSPIESVRFRPFEDICAIGHTIGVTGMICPGAGYANFDAYEA